MVAKQANHRSKVFVAAYDERDSVIEEQVLAYDEYYSASSPLIDSSRYRAQRGIRRITGRIYNSAGELQAEFKNTYDDQGKYVRGTTVHQDGTVTKD